jgi:hypothetical protein
MRLCYYSFRIEFMVWNTEMHWTGIRKFVIRIDFLFCGSQIIVPLFIVLLSFLETLLLLLLLLDRQPQGRNRKDT